MADFNDAYALTGAHKGGYVKDPVERGGESYRGIARIHYPDWKGWRRIDSQRRKVGFRKRLTADRALQENVKAFYKQVYWDRIQGDKIADQAVANELYDTAVNMGVRRAVRILQSSLNMLNRNQRDYGDLIIDGWFGKRTLSTLSARLEKDRRSDALVKMMNIQQGARYIEIMTRDVAQERFARGWITRS